jgi:molybdate transport system substrate-binding protein
VIRALALVAASATVAAGCGGAGAGGSGSSRLVVSAAASMKEALTACAGKFDEAEDASVKQSFAGSDELAAQIRQGAKVDVYAAANTKLPDQLHSDGLIGTPVRFATNELVLGVPNDSQVDSVKDLAKHGTKVVIGSASVPIGSYTRKTLAKLPLAQEKAILANVRSNEPDVKGIVGKLTQGAADAGFVYLTDVNATGGKLRTIKLPHRLEPRVTYAAAVVRKAKEPDLGKKYVAGLTQGDCAAALTQAGFGRAP